MDRDLAIGALERDGTGWRSLPEPLITSTPDRPEVLEPKVIHDPGCRRRRAVVRGRDIRPCGRPRGGDTLHVFFTAAHPPDPEPYILTTGRLDIPLADLPEPNRSSDAA